VPDNAFLTEKHPVMNPLQTTSYAVTVSLGLLFWALEGLLPFFKGRRRRGKHASLNLSIAGLNLLVLLPSGILMALVLHEANSLWPGIRGLDIPPLAQTALVLAGIDLWMYAWHRMNHKNDFLWRFHSVHHSDPDLDVTTAWRFHIMKILFSETLRYPVFILLGAGIGDLVLYTMLMTPVIEFHHSNIRIPSGADRLLRVIIPTPLMHRLHHSTIRAEHDSNYGSMLSIWDRMFGSFQLKENIGQMPLGLINESGPGQQRLTALLTRPFRN